MKRIATFLALATWATGLVACLTAAPPPPPVSAPAPPSVTGAPAEAPAPAGPAAVAPAPRDPAPPPTDGPAPVHSACHLPIAKKSGDACKGDQDCAPSDPCHAKACVARAKAKPRTPDLMCTMMMGCETADANRCGCFEGRCSLIPPDDAAKE